MYCSLSQTKWRTVKTLVSYHFILTKLSFSARINAWEIITLEAARSSSPYLRRKTRILSTVSQDGNLKIAPRHTHPLQGLRFCVHATEPRVLPGDYFCAGSQTRVLRLVSRENPNIPHTVRASAFFPFAFLIGYLPPSLSRLRERQPIRSDSLNVAADKNDENNRRTLRQRGKHCIKLFTSSFRELALTST